MSSPYRQGETIYDTFHVGITGLVDGDFTKRIYKNNGPATETITIVELGSGDYGYEFTPLALAADYAIFIFYQDFIFNEIFAVRDPATWGWGEGEKETLLTQVNYLPYIRTTLSRLEQWVNQLVGKLRGSL